ncbi:metallopeptidase [Penicillium malachiteum]|uniref:metallopeptidase n=1 Tax=Penicillium malachiteum TaxID=1324776 RepID=UPI0025489673|nr:metallopeptidase [Penicillium malachiteum]KAJ5715960.1 metallopeptidase [Penicillium malachiteum]
MSEYKQPPQPPFKLNQSPEQVMQATHDGIATSRASLDLLAAKPMTDWTFDGFIVPFSDDENHIVLESTLVQIYGYVSKDKELRDASRAALQLWNEYEREVNSRQDLFNGIDAVYKKSEDGSIILDPEERHYLDRVYLKFLRNAVHINGETKEQYQVLQKRIDELSRECLRNVQEETEGVWFEEAELKGLPAAYVVKGKRDADNRVFVGLKKHDMDVVLKFATEESTRKRVYIAAENKCAENVALFEELVSSRARVASLLGYASFAEYKIQGRMLNLSQVMELLNSIRKQVADKAASERVILMEAKKQFLIEQGKSQDEIDPRIHIWDSHFYSQLVRAKKFDINDMAVAEYFPLEHTLSGILKIFEQMFGLHFQPVDSGAWVWDEAVTVSAVWNEESMGGEFLGYVYFDLFERPGKFNNNCNAYIAPGFRGSRTFYPGIALLASFSSIAPVLLRHRQVVTLFHELGHTIHYLVGQTRFASTYGTSTAFDFVEIPSLMLENWCWTPSILHSLSRHYTYTSDQEKEAYLKSHDHLPAEKPPIELFERLLASKAVNEACQMLSQLHCTLYDLTVHGTTPVKDLSALYNQIRRECTSLFGPDSHGEGDNWGSGQARFQHFFKNYAAGYYVYFLGDAFSGIMFNTRFQQNPLDEAEGRRYRHMVLGKGGSLPELPLLEEFVGGKIDASKIFGA